MQGIFGKEYSFSLCLLRNLSHYKSKKGRERNGTETRTKIPDKNDRQKQGNPADETVIYKIGGTFYEVSTSCGGSEPLFEKMKRLIKSENLKAPTDKGKEVRYNEDRATCLSGVHYRRNEHDSKYI